MAYFECPTYDSTVLSLPTPSQASGAVANFDTDVVLPLIDVKAEIKAVETGTGAKSPSNPYVISGSTGCHLNYVDFNQLAKEISDNNYSKTASTVSYSDGVATITATGNYARIGFKSGTEPTIQPNHVYMFSVTYRTNYTHGLMAMSIQIGGTYKYKAIASPQKGVWETAYLFIKSSTNAYSYANFGDITTNYVGGEITEVKNIQMFDLTQAFGSTIADYLFSLSDNGLSLIKTIFYKDYYNYNVGGSLVTLASVNSDNTQSALVSWQTEAGEVFGGYYDFTTGKLVVTHKKITLNGSQTIVLKNWQPKDNSVGFAYSADEYDGKRPTANNTALDDLISDQLTTQSYSGIYGGSVDWAIAVMSSTAYGIFVRLGDVTLTTEALINAYLSQNPIEVVYPLATPVEYDLAPQQISALLGVNNIWNDTNGSTTVKYFETVRSALH